MKIFAMLHCVSLAWLAISVSGPFKYCARLLRCCKHEHEWLVSNVVCFKLGTAPGGMAFIARSAS